MRGLFLAKFQQMHEFHLKERGDKSTKDLIDAYDEMMRWMRLISSSDESDEVAQELGIIKLQDYVAVKEKIFAHSGKRKRKRAMLVENWNDEWHVMKNKRWVFTVPQIQKLLPSDFEIDDSVISIYRKERHLEAITYTKRLAAAIRDHHSK